MLIINKSNLNSQELEKIHNQNVINEFLDTNKKNDPASDLIDEMMMFDVDGHLLNEIELKLKMALRQIISDPDIASQGYCVQFKMGAATAAIDRIMEKLPFLTKSTMQYAFVKTWGMTLGTSEMREKPFYIFLIFVSLYAIEKQKNKYKPEDNEIAKLCQLLICLDLWNGQHKKYITFCQPDVMKYVISVEMNRSYLAKKYENPLQLIKKTYIDPEGTSIPKKYFPRMAADRRESIQMIDAAWKRIRQLFASTRGQNLKTHLMTYTSGIAPLYHDAAKDNLRISTAKAFDAENGDISDTYSTSSYDEYVDAISNSITMSTNPTYPTGIKNRIKADVSIDANRIDILMKSIHELKYQDYVHDMLENMFAKLTGITKDEVCSPAFYDTVKKKIISSKHNTNVDKVKKIADLMCSEVYGDKMGMKDYNGWSNNYKTNSINTIIYTLAYNIRDKICND